MDQNGGEAFIAPSVITPDLQKLVYGDPMQQYRMSQMAEQKYKQKQIDNQREFDRQAKASKFVGDSFKDSNFATGTAADPLITDQLAQARTKYAKLIHQNPNMDEGELESQMQQDLGQISKFSEGVKAGRKNIEELGAHYGQQPGIDVDRLKQGAMNRMLYTTDASGKKTLNKNPDLSVNYLDEELKNNPDMYVQGDVPLMKSIEQYKPKEGGSTSISEHSGTTTEDKFSSKVYPWQSYTKDSKGNTTGLDINSKTVSVGGKQLNTVDDETFQKVMNPGVAAMLKRDTDAYVKKNGLSLDPESEDYKNIGKSILLGKLKGLTPSEFKTEHKKTNASFIDKMQAGLVNAAGKDLTKSQEKKDEELGGSKFGTLLKAANQDPAIINSGLPYKDPKTGEDYIDITSTVGGFNTDADKEKSVHDPGHQQVTNVLVKPGVKGRIYTVENGEIHENTKQDISAMMRRHATANGYKNMGDIDRLEKIVPVRDETVADKRARLAKEELEKRKQANQNPYQFNP